MGTTGFPPSGPPSEPLAPTYIPIEELAVIINLVGAVLIRYLTFFCILADIGRKLLPLGDKVGNGRRSEGSTGIQRWYPPEAAAIGRGFSKPLLGASGHKVGCSCATRAAAVVAATYKRGGSRWYGHPKGECPPPNLSIDAVILRLGPRPGPSQ